MVTVMAVTAWRTRMSFPPLMTSKVPVQMARRMKRFSEPSGDLQGGYGDFTAGIDPFRIADDCFV